MPAFVIEYNRRTGRTNVTSFTDPQAAMRRRFELSRERFDDSIEIVSISARSLEDVKRTHSRYFQSEELAASA